VHDGCLVERNTSIGIQFSGPGDRLRRRDTPSDNRTGCGSSTTSYASDPSVVEVRRRQPRDRHLDLASSAVIEAP
jgi:hypothetical protein